MRVYSILYFTNNYKKYTDFRDSDCKQAITFAYNSGTQVLILDSFDSNSGSPLPFFTSLRDLANYLDAYRDNLSDLIVVMDCQLARRSAKKSLQAILIEYPDVKFLFDEDPQWVIFNQNDISAPLQEKSIEECYDCLKEIEQCTDKGVVKQEFKDLLELDTPDYWSLLRQLISSTDPKIEDAVRRVRKELIRQIAMQSVIFDFLKIPQKDIYFVLNLVHSQDNLFDASNIRYAIKQWKYAELDVHSRNFLLIQDSRRDNLAISVEEEKSQNRFNSYCLFANGFRVWPVTSARELLKVNSEAKRINPSIIVRDYDLQFFDSSCVTSGDSREAIKEIRGFRDYLDGTWETHAFTSSCWSSFYENFREEDNSSDSFSALSNASIVSVSYEELVSCPIYFVSKGTWNVSILHPGSFIVQEHNRLLRISHYYTDINGNCLCLPGLTKPISGIYAPFSCIPEIRKRLKAIKTSTTDYLDTSREGHSHGTSLDIYANVKSLIRRAEEYYNNKKYVHAAILSNEAIEYLNGFHEALLLKAYQVLAISENAIAMDTVGGDESYLKEDTLFRINKIELEIDRILRRSSEEGKSHEDRREFKYNILNQIFSDCRQFCKDKERFSAEDCFISAMAHENEGFTPRDIINEIKLVIKSIKKSWISNKSELNSD